jgi:hypothetical protein
MRAVDDFLSWEGLALSFLWFLWLKLYPANQLYVASKDAKLIMFDY